MKTGHSTIEYPVKSEKKPQFSIGAMLVCFAGAGLFAAVFAKALAVLISGTPL